METVPTDLIKLAKLVDVKKNVYDLYDELGEKVNAIDPGKLSLTQKLKKLERKCQTIINIPLLMNLISEIFEQTKLATKTDIADFVKKTYFDDQPKYIK